MTSRIHNRTTAAVACGLLFVVGSELLAEMPAAPAMRSVFEPSESLAEAHLFSTGMRIRRATVAVEVSETVGTEVEPVAQSSIRFVEQAQKTSPHLFLGETRLASQLEQRAQTAAQVQPTKVELVSKLYNPVSESPFRLASLPAKAEAQEKQLRPAEVKQAATPEFKPAKAILANLPKRESATEARLQTTEVRPVVRVEPAKQETKLAELPTRQSGPTVVLQRAEVMRADRPEFVAGEIHLASLPSRFPEPAAALNPTAVFAAEGVDHPQVAEPEFQLASLQQRYGEPIAPLQSAEVLPIPSPNSPAAPHVPTLDQDRPIGALSTSIAPTTGKLPVNLAMEKFHGDYPAWLPREWNEVTYFWDAPDLCYGPLRYEEANLERFGYTHCPIVQPAMSAAHFFCATLALPYSMAMRPHHECIYSLGHYRPGSPVPYRKIWPEWNPLAASVEVGTIAGLILLIP